jgi:hypothetical protein
VAIDDFLPRRLRLDVYIEDLGIELASISE